MAADLPRRAPLFVPPPRALLIDAGFTLVSYDGVRIAALAAEFGVEVHPEAVEATEPAMRAELAEHDWPQRPGAAAPIGGGERFLRRVLQLAGGRSSGGDAGRALDAAAEGLWREHLRENLWSRPLPAVVPALQALREAGVALAVVSNSEGTLAALFDRIDFTRHFDTIVDSWLVGVTKPDPRIFQIALERVGVAPAEAVMVGDSWKADILGAQAAGVPAALIDPGDLYREASVPRFPDFPAFARAVLDARSLGRRAPVAGS